MCDFCHFVGCFWWFCVKMPQKFSFKMFCVFLKRYTFVVENIAMNFKTRGKLTINLTQCKYEKD